MVDQRKRPAKDTVELLNRRPADGSLVIVDLKQFENMPIVPQRPNDILKEARVQENEQGSYKLD